MENQITISKAFQNESWQEFLCLKNGYLREIGEQPAYGRTTGTTFPSYPRKQNYILPCKKRETDGWDV